MNQAEEVLGVNLEVGGGALAGEIILNFPLLSLHIPQLSEATDLYSQWP